MMFSKRTRPFTVTVSNLGASPVDGVQVMDVLPAGLGLVAALAIPSLLRARVSANEAASDAAPANAEMVEVSVACMAAGLWLLSGVQ